VNGRWDVEWADAFDELFDDAREARIDALQMTYRRAMGVQNVCFSRHAIQSSE
jgi:hypothetical protein